MPIITINNGPLEYLAAEGIAVPHCFTTRQGGVSEGHLASLNIGVHRGDDPENVAENYRRLGAALGFRQEDLVLTRQTHSDIVRVVGRDDAGKGLIQDAWPECDGLITNTPGVALAVFTADCTPILLQDPVTGAVGAVHAGWRGTAADIAGKAVRAMEKEFGCDPADIRAAVGPNIGRCCFATDADVPEAMVEALGRSALTFIHSRGGKYYVDLKQINARFLKNAGVGYIEISDACTACRPDRFWSHRITGGQRGSQGAIIVCKEEAN